MAHGYLSYSPVTGESPLAKMLYDKLKKLIKDEGKKNAKKVLSGVKDILKKDKDTSYRNKIGKRYDVVGGGKKDKPGGGMLSGGAEPKGLLGAGKGGLVKRDDKVAVVGKNATNVDKKEQAALPPASGSGRSRKGGGVVNMGGSVSKGLNADSFLEKSLSGVDSSGEYLSTADRKAMFKKSVEMRSSASPSSDITGGSGDEIVAAIKQNTAAISTLVDTTEEQIQSDVNIAQRAVQAQETMFSRQKARKEEQKLEEGEDLSSTLKPETFLKDLMPKGGGGGGDDKKGGGFPGSGLAKKFLPKGGGKGFAGLGKAGLIAAAAVVGLVGGLSFGTHLGHKYNEAQKAKQPKRDRLGNRLDDEGNVLFGPSKPGGPDLQGPGISTEEQWTKEGTLPEAIPQEEIPLNPGYNQGGLVTGGKANKIDDVNIRADEGEVVMSNAAGNMFGRDSFLSMNALAGSTNKPSSGDGFAQGGQVGFNARTRKLYRAMGEGILDAQLENKKDFAELQSEGLKTYFENKGGAQKFGEGLKNFFGDASNAISGIGNFFSSLFGGGNQPGTPNAPGYQGPSMSASEQQLTEALIAGEEGVKTKAYKDSEGIWTIGYGQTTINGRAVREGDEISKEQALTGFRGALAEHQQRAINQVGEKRWAEMDPKMRAVLSSLTYNYGSIPDRVLSAAKTGSAEDLARAMDSLHGDNNGDLKGRRQREQSILRGNMQGTQGNPLRLDKDFLAGGKFAGQGTGPSITLSSPGTPSGQAEGLTGSAPIYPMPGPSAETHQVGPRNGKMHHGTDIVETPEGGKYRGDPRTPILAMADGEVIADPTNNFQQDAYLAGVMVRHPSLGVDARYLHMNPNVKPGTPVKRGQVIGSLVPIASGDDPYGNTHLHLEMYKQGTHENIGAAGKNKILGGSQKVAMSQIKPGGMPAAPASTPSIASAASPAPGSSNNGTQVMATSAQVAMASNAPSAAPTIINNYYGSGGDQGGTPVPNGVSPGIGMDQTGTSVFQELKLRSLA